jgi:hypothetical protein
MWHRTRPRLAIAGIALVAVMGTTACARFRSGDRARAVQRLQEIDGLLTDLDRAYAAGKSTEAKQLALKIDFSFDNSIAETMVTELDRPLHRKLERILEKDLIARVDEGAPVSEVSALIGQGHQLVGGAIREIGR